MDVPSPTAILIVGMHRSGTSALAGLVAKLGVPLGDHLLAPGSDNPKGYWEHKGVVALHERLLSRLGSRWDDVRALPEGWIESEPAREASLAIDELISRDFSGTFVWAVKDPRLCRVLPLWAEALRKRGIRPVVLFTVRRPSEVSASIEKRNHWRPLVGTLLWLRYTTEAATASLALPREVIFYDDLLVDPVGLVTKALENLGIEIGSEVSGEQRKIITDFVSVYDRHHFGTGDDRPSSGVDAIAAELFQSLVAIAHGANSWSPVATRVQEFHEYWQKNGACIDALADMAARIEQDLQSAHAANLELKSALIAQTRWSDEAKAKHEVLQAEKADLSSKLIAQIRWSDEEQAKYQALQAVNAEISSQLTAQIRWSEEAQARHEALQAKSAELSSQLTAQIRWSEEAQAKYEALQAEHAKLLSNLAAQVARMGNMEAEAARASAQHAAEMHEASAERDRIARELERGLAEKAALSIALESIHASLLWKVTKPLRSASLLLRNKTGPTHGSTRKPK